MVSPITYPAALGCNYPAPTVVVYHHLSDDRDALVQHLGVTTRLETFRAHLRYYGQHYDIISQADLLGGRLPRRALLITFDDLYRSVLDVAGPMLREVKAPSLLFLNPSAILKQTIPIDNLMSLAFQVLGGAHMMTLLGCDEARALTVTQAISRVLCHLGLEGVQALRRRMTTALGLTDAQLWHETRLFLNVNDVASLADCEVDIGNHSMTHSFFRSLSSAEVFTEIAGAKLALEGMTKKPIHCLSVPYGNEKDATPAALAIARTAGHRAIFLVQGRSNRWRPGPDVLYRTSPGDVQVRLLPLIIRGLPFLRGAFVHLRPAAASSVGRQAIQNTYGGDQ